MFRAAKDALASEAARRYLNGLVARYGEVNELRIDSKNKTMCAVCRLEGEAEPVAIDVAEYEIQAVGKDKVLRLGTCRCSRPWLQNLLTDFVRGREIKLPGWAAAAL